MNYKIHKESIGLFLFTVIVFFLTRQVPFNSYSIIMNIALILFFVYNYKNILITLDKLLILKYIFFSISIILFSFIFYSLYLNNEPNLIIRFVILLSLIMLSYTINPDKRYISIFLFFIILQSLFIIGFEIFLLINFDILTYIPIRHYFNNMGYGDVFTFGGMLYKIQLLGNALLPFGLFIVWLFYSGYKKYLFSIVIFIAITFAGNFAFILALIIFYILYFLYKTRWTLQNIVLNSFFIIILVLFTGKPIYNYFGNVIKHKAISSNPVRIDQFNVLISDMNNNLGTLVFGKGLGNTVDIKTEWRNYENRVYYELQSIYILNQIGFVLFLMFIFINILLSLHFIKYKILLITYFTYIFYASFNPYFLDTNHIVVIIVLISLRKVFDEKNIYNTRSI
ncbi:oligosaccharide repeat unit polymerase [bacterium]|nr:oligosaccharide repeat unit polymerase [bacterium]